MSAPVVPGTEPAGLLSDATLSDLQLRRQPFAELGPDDEAFADETTGEQLGDIKQALITGDDLLLVLGEVGAGKSTLLAQLGANSGLRLQCFEVRGSERFSTHNLFTGMLEAFKQAPPDELKDMLDALVPCLQGMVANNILSAIVLDNADSVTDGELTRLLSSMLYLNSQDETLLRVVLAAADSFEDRIPELLPEGADLPYSSLSVEAFDDDRASAYLAFRMHKAGWLGALPFPEEELADINARAGGLPRLLHQEAAGALEARSLAAPPAPGPAFDTASEAGVHVPPPPVARAEPRGAFGARWPKLALAAVAIALIGGGLWLSRPGDDPDEGPSYTVVEQRPVDTGTAAPADVPTVPPDPERLAGARSAVDPDPVPDAVPGADAAGGSPLPDVVEAPLPLPAPAAPEPTVPVETDVASAEPAGTPAIRPEPEPTPEPPPEPTPSSEPASTPEPADGSRAPTDEELLATAPPAAPAGPASGLEPSTWILLQEADRFTVQMSASTDRASVENFLRRAGLEGPNSIFAFDRDGTTWYALVHGLYASVGEARTAVERMPAQAQSNQPWIRAVGRIQAVLREQD